MLCDSAFAKPFLPREDNVLHISLCVLRALVRVCARALAHGRILIKLNI